jgi:hypothetical protein
MADRRARKSITELYRSSHFPLARDRLKRLGHILAELGTAIAAACWARAWRRDDDALAREMLRQGFTRCSFARERSDTRAGSGEARKRLVLAGRCLQLLEA